MSTLSEPLDSILQGNTQTGKNVPIIRKVVSLALKFEGQQSVRRKFFSTK